METKNLPRSRVALLAMPALGVVYGDIGTSPLYALRECFHASGKLSPTSANVLGILSLIFWSLVVVVSIKYIALVMRADNRGEGGILALLALAFPDRGTTGKRGRVLLISLGVFGAAMLYGDGTLTPTITVLSAIEGLEVATVAVKPLVLPIAVGILVALFSIQRIGTASVGRAFGPVMLLWFVCIAGLGVKEVMRAPGVFACVGPHHAIGFLLHNGWLGFVVLSAVFLVVTGTEALYADMGHFGRRPIRLAWFCVVMPALFLNYLGQGALLIRDPAARSNPFFGLVSGWALYPLVGLSTLAAIIASQALISGAFSLTRQAMQLGYCPRVQIEHTSSEEKGQIYVPYVNWMLLGACLILVFLFRTSSRLAAAYGIAVVVTMLITTLLFYFAARRVWRWKVWQAGSVCGLLLLVDIAFLVANSTKFLHGGWFPLLLALAIYLLMSTWDKGRRTLRERMRSTLVPMDQFIESLRDHAPLRVPGTAVFMAGNPDGTPIALLHNLKHNKVLHKRVIVLTIVAVEVPEVSREERVEIKELHPGFFRMVARFGFMEDPTVPEVLDRCREMDFPIDPMVTTFFLSRETILADRKSSGFYWRKRLFAIMSRNAQPVTAFFHLPANRVVELGMQIEL